VFVGFHVTPPSRDTIAKHAEYLKRYEPIGTRDIGTAEFLNGLGIKTEITYCMSLTFPRRAKEPANGKVIRVDARGIEIPKSLRRGSIELSHIVEGMKNGTKLQYARDLVEFYRDNARLVITTRLHCALPCIAMGIPVIFFGDPNNNRTSIVGDIGGTLYDRKLHKKGLMGKIAMVRDPVDWSPKPLEVEALKDNLLRAVSSRLAALRKSEYAG
jgi:hypothetical protein